MEIILASIAVAAGVLTLVVGIAQLRRTPKREPEPFTPTSLTIIGVPMHRGPDLYGKDYWRSNG